MNDKDWDAVVAQLAEWASVPTMDMFDDGANWAYNRMIDVMKNGGAE